MRGRRPWPPVPGLVGALVPLARRPDLWATGLRSAAHLARPGWWHRPPFLPIPDRDWMRFRLVTAYGGDGSAPLGRDDLVTWLDWRRRWVG